MTNEGHSPKLNLILSECFDDIFSNFEKDTKALYSFLFVNRFWCKIIIPLLWKYPFSIMSRGKEIETLSSLLSEEEKSEIIKKGIELPPRKFSSALFNYVLYIKEYNTSTLFQSIESWYAKVVYDNVYYRIPYTADVKVQLKNIFVVFTKLIMRGSKNIKNLSLLPINAPDIDTFNIPFHLSEIFVNSHPGFKNVENFEFDVSFNMPNVLSLLKLLTNVSHNIQDLRIYGKRMVDKKDVNIDLIVSLIKAQHKLNIVLLEDVEFTPILEALSTHSISLTTLQLSQFSEGVSLVPIRQFKNLQYLSLFGCENMDENMFNDFSEIDFNLKSLNIDEMNKTSLKSLLRLTNKNLKRISFHFNTSTEVIQDFFIRCPNISYLNIKFREELMDFFFLSMLENLTHLTVTITSYSFLYSHEILIELSHVYLPKLKFLSIKMPKSAGILKDYLKITHSPLQTILLTTSNKISIEYIDALLKFSKKKRTLKIVGISLSSDDNNFKKFVTMTEGYLQIVNLWDVDRSF